MTTQPIDRVSGLTTTEFVSRYELPERPCVLEGAILHWRACQTWNPAHLKSKLGGVEVQFKLSNTHRHPDFCEASLAKTFARGKSSFGDLLDHLTSAPPGERAQRLFTGDEQFLVRRRHGESTVNEALRPLLDDVEIPSLVPPDRLYTIWAWFSGRGVRTWLHYDNNGCHNLNAQITGTKSCVLYAPHELSKIAPFPLGGPNPAHNCSQIDVEAPDKARFPVFEQVSGFEAVLRPGDLLFIPAWWFHTFVHQGELNSNVNFWWKPEQPIMNEVAARQALIDQAASGRSS